MEYEICRKVVNLGKYGERTLVYTVISKYSEEFCRVLYGISIKVLEDGDEIVIRDITSLKDDVDRIISKLAAGFVTPVTALDVVYDLISEM